MPEKIAPRAAATKRRTRLQRFSFRPMSSNGPGHRPMNGRRAQAIPAVLRQRTRTGLPWYAKALRRRGQHWFGWSFAVVAATPNAHGVFRHFRRFAAVSLVIAAGGVIGLAELPSAPVAIGGTATMLLVIAFVTGVVGDDEHRCRDKSPDGATPEEMYTTAQLICLGSLAGVGGIALPTVIWALLGPLSSLTIRLFDLWGIVVFMLLVIGLVLFGVPLLLLGLVAAARSFSWYKADVLIFPLVPLVVLFLATLTRLGLG